MSVYYMDRFGHILQNKIVQESRPVVVIDPADPLDRKAITEIIQRVGSALNYEPGADLSHIRRAVHGALRSLVAPPKPEEPTGLGAVIEDEHLVQWVRIQTDYSHPWLRRGCSASDLHAYSDIAAVRVLSEGVAA